MRTTTVSSCHNIIVKNSISCTSFDLCCSFLEREADAPQETTLPPRCAAVSCFLQPVCESGEILDTPEGECCPRCVPDCSLLQCDIPVCPFGQVARTLKGDCCPSCALNCIAVLCGLPICQPGEFRGTPEGQCCPRCLPDCSAVQCPVFKCKPGQILVTPQGECCPKCMRDCSAILCFRPECGEGEELYTPEGECCPLCRPIECEIEGQVFSECASCPRTCENPLVICSTVCRRGCECPSRQVLDTANRRCVPMEKCPQNGKQLVWTLYTHCQWERF